MSRKRKRPCSAACDDIRDPRKCIKNVGDQGSSSHPTLCLYYTKTSTLREYIRLKLPKTSRARRRRIVSAEDDFLDRTLVCTTGKEELETERSCSKDFEAFLQQVSLTTDSSIEEGSTSQSDLIDFAIWLLFHKIHRDGHRPPHILCHGYQRAANPKQANEDHGALAGIPGIVSHYPNNNVEILKSASWIKLLSLLGQEGERIMLDIVLECGLFVEVGEGEGNYFQLSGVKDENYHLVQCGSLVAFRQAPDRIATPKS